MRQLKVTPRAQEDLFEIWSFLSQQNLKAAEKLMREFAKKFDRILEYPEIGRTRHQFIINLRSLAVGKYVIFYQPSDDGVEILRVLHGSRNMQKAFDEM